MSAESVIRYEMRGRAAWITLDRPAVRNALSNRLVAELYAGLERAGADDAVRTIVVTGAGSAFCAGADLKDPPAVAGGGDAVTFTDVMRAIWDGPKPVIAAVNGPAFAGGLGLLGAADIVIAAEEAVFGFSEVRIGVIPANVAVVCLRKLGRHHGMRLFLTGERFDGRRAVELGLVHRAVPRAGLEAAVDEETDAIARGGPVAVGECKKLVRAIPGSSLAEDFELTEPWSAGMFRSAEAAEGMAAFRERRPAGWVEPATPGEDREDR